MSVPTVTDVVCPLCGCLCDDIRVEVEGNAVKKVRGACAVGRAKILGHGRLKSPLLREGDELRECSYEEAIKRAAEILAAARRPLLYGWSCTVCETHKVGILLAEVLGGVIDNTASVCHGPTVQAVQGVGLPTCTLGEVKNRADLVIFWGANPVEAHGNHMRRYSYLTKGWFRPEGKKDRKLVVVDVRESRTARMADIFIRLEPNKDYLVLAALRAIVNGFADVVPESVGGVPKERLVELAEMMKTAQFGIIFFGMGLTQSRYKHNNIEQAISLVRDLYAFTKFAIMPMRGHYNVTGFNQVCTWQTGFPFAVDLARGYAWYNPGETAANDVLSRKECDAALIVASDPAAHFPAECVKHLAKIPLVVIDPYPSPTTEIADVVIPSAVCGVEAEGTAYRMDKVPLRLRKLVETEFLTDEEILERLLDEVLKIKGLQ